MFMAYPPDPVRVVDTFRLALARLREGTEILRTGGGTTLTAAQCNALLDVLEKCPDPDKPGQ
jgi:hypothetical protein